MGFGDNLMATGMARGAAVRGKRIAFGDQHSEKIHWDHHSELVFRGNPNIAPPGTRSKSNIEWIGFYRGSRIYNTKGDGRWIWNYEFRAKPGEMFFTRVERIFGAQVGRRFIVIEPNVPAFKSVAPNKQWPVDRYEWVAKKLKAAGCDVVQMVNGSGYRLVHARHIATDNFRLAMAVLSNARLYIGPEGGLHHGAAAIGIPAVVLFGGFVPPQVTGYDTHTNLTGGAEACGSFNRCPHCSAAMNAISCDEVLVSAKQHLERPAA